MARSLDKGASFLRALVSIITLAVDDLERSLAFYRDGMGLPTNGIAPPEHGGDHILFELEGGLSLVLFDRRKVAALSGAQGGAGDTILTQPVEAREDVDAVLAQAEIAGGRRVGKARAESWGYSGYFADPDGHLWEVIAFTPQ
jgi:catechol 2,3-dioxygenase-like lactoylglutathione lyase family enzyme